MGRAWYESWAMQTQFKSGLALKGEGMGFLALWPPAATLGGAEAKPGQGS